MPEREEPRGATQSAAEQTGRTIGPGKVERLQKREQAAENIAACENQKGPLWLDRILSKQKNGRDEIGDANDGLNNRNKNVEARRAVLHERQNDGKHDRQGNGNAERNAALLLAGRKARDQGRNLFALAVS